nr:uncharacterized protein LOC111421274 [Onthophagus taurus]
MGLIDDDDFPDHDKKRAQADTAYYSIKALACALQGDDTASLPASHLLAIPKLTKLSIPIFDGNYKNWPTFYDLFRTMLHENPSISNVAKYQYLLTSLKGDAFNLIKSLPVTDDNYPIAYSALTGRYHNKRYLATIYFNEIIHLKSATDESVKSFHYIIDTFKDNVEGFRTLGFPVDSWDFLLFNILLQKLTTTTKTQFEEHHTSVEIPTYVKLIKFLEGRAKALESVQLTSVAKTAQSKPKLNSKERPTISFKIESTSFSKKCLLCPEIHQIYRCPNFKSKSTSERLDVARANNLCRNCLSSSHSTSKCQSSHRCFTCRQHHHTLLHFNSPVNNSVHVGTTSCRKERSINQNTTTNVLLPTVFLKIKDIFGRCHLVRALIDSGSMSNFITDKLSKRLCLPRDHGSSITIQGLNSTKSICNRGTVNCYVQPCEDSTPSFEFKAVITPNICSNQPSLKLIIDSYPHLKKLNFQQDIDSNLKEIDLLLGAELVPQILTSGRVQGNLNDPIALDSVFLWIVMGRTEMSSFDSSKSVLVNGSTTCLSIINDSLDNTLKRFWEIETLPSATYLSKVEQQCEVHFKRTHHRTSDGRFIVALPFKNHEPVLGQS